MPHEGPIPLPALLGARSHQYNNYLNEPRGSLALQARILVATFDRPSAAAERADHNCCENNSINRHAGAKSTQLADLPLASESQTSFPAGIRSVLAGSTQPLLLGLNQFKFQICVTLHCSMLHSRCNSSLCLSATRTDAAMLSGVIGWLACFCMVAGR